jgi:hypothetical protein
MFRMFSVITGNGSSLTSPQNGVPPSSSPDHMPRLSPAVSTPNSLPSFMPNMDALISAARIQNNPVSTGEHVPISSNYSLSPPQLASFYSSFGGFPSQILSPNKRNLGMKIKDESDMMETAT